MTDLMRGGFLGLQPHGTRLLLLLLLLLLHDSKAVSDVAQEAVTVQVMVAVSASEGFPMLKAIQADHTLAMR